MINGRFAIPDINRTIVDNIAHTAVTTMRNILSLPISDDSIRRVNDIAEFKSNGGQTTPVESDDNNIKTATFFYKVKEGVDANVLNTSMLNSREYKPIIVDNEVPIICRPVLVRHKYDFEFVFKSKSATQVENLLVRLKMLAAAPKNTILLNIPYFYYIPLNIVDLLLETNNIKNSVIGTNVSLPEYISSVSDSRTEIAGDISGNTKHLRLIVKETQLDVVGIFDDDVESLDKQYDIPSATWSITFNFYLLFQRPSAIDVSYDLIVYNRKLPERFITVFNQNADKNSCSSLRTYYGASMGDVVTLSDQFCNYGQRAINIPRGDYFNVPKNFDFFKECMSVLVTITHEDKRSLFNIGILPDYQVSADIISFLKQGEYQYITQRFNSIFYLYLVDNDGVVYDGDKIAINSNLDVSTTFDLDIKKTYRVVCNILYKTLFLSMDAKRRLSESNLLINTLFNVLELKDSTKDYMLTKFNNIILYENMFKPQAWTVLHGFIIARRKKES